MPRNNRANIGAILESYTRLNNMKAVSRELGYAYTTVVQVVYQSRGLCQCGKPIDNRSKRFCSNCLANQRLFRARRRETFARTGSCLVCGKPRDHDGPASRRSNLCSTCRAYRLLIQAKYRMTHGAIMRMRRYGGLWGLVMERDDWSCRVCSEPAKEVHHLDENDKHHAMENLFSLCRSCHLTLTRMNSHPNLPKLLELVKNHYSR